MSNENNEVEWILPVVDSKNTALDKFKQENLPKAAWTSVAIGVVTKKILQNAAVNEYPFIAEDD